jgi:hypothetical protein
MQMNNIDICIYLINFLDDIFYVDHVQQLRLIHTDNEDNKKLSVFLIVFQ